MASPSEDHPLAINQLKLVGIIGTQIISALIHAGDCYVQDIAHFKVTRVHDARVRTFPGAVPIGLRNVLDVLCLADVDVGVGAKTGRVGVDDQVRTRLVFLSRLSALVARDEKVEVGERLVTDREV